VGKFQHGAVEFPLTTDSDRTLLEDVDPALFHALAYFAWALDYYLGARLVAQAQAIDAPIAMAVNGRVAVEPAPYLTGGQFRFPLLALYRQRERTDARTTVWMRDTSEWEVAYVLPFMAPAQSSAIQPVLRAVGRVISDRCLRGADPAYTPPGGTAGENTWRRAGIEQIRLREASYGSYPLIQSEVSKMYPAWIGRLEVSERDQAVIGAFEPFGGAVIHEDIASPDEDPVLDVVVVDTGVTVE